VPVKDKEGHTFLVSKDDPRYISGELKFISCGTVNVRDKDGNTMRVATDDARYISGELIPAGRGKQDGKIMAKDKFGNHYRVERNDPRWLSGELVGIASKKFKDVRECDLKVVGYKYGNPGTKYETMLGSLICESEDGLLKVDVGSGYIDEIRKSTNESIIGTIIAVKYNQVIKDVDGNHSLYLPVFSEFRTDKSVADNLDKIKKNG